MARPYPVETYRYHPNPPGHHYARGYDVPFGEADEPLPFPVPASTPGGWLGAVAFSVAVALTTHLLIRWWEKP